MRQQLGGDPHPCAESRAEFRLNRAKLSLDRPTVKAARSRLGAQVEPAIF